MHFEGLLNGLIQLEDFGQLLLLVALIGHVHVRLRKDVVRLLCALPGPHVDKRLRELGVRIVQRHDGVPPLLVRRRGEPRGRRVLHGQPRLRLSPKSANVLHIEQDEHLHADEDDVDVGEHLGELVLVFGRARLLWHARKVEPHVLDLGVVVEVALQGGQLRALRVRLVGLLPPMAGAEHVFTVVAEERAGHVDGLLHDPVGVRALEVLQPRQPLHAAAADLARVEEVEAGRRRLTALPLSRAHGR
mmetsp:Transcript_64887/g.128275  ORF Transcript_64887/g.128275 Transcript_64887/m.128275 type:complete len:246 (+) Transcript_64887:610-1347(+)